ncbi:HpcH/HpaI aldolase family protein [Tsukamurella soli]|uniref:4-hydroxy-2-oxoheptanedioate aldolase n=1 Tax=Tsukamurella soli TaxID=644556 RepID=A0ABP8J3T7_9ACTN
MSLRLKPTFRDVLAGRDGPLIGVWTVTGSVVAAEIMAGSGADLLLIDGEHGPFGVGDVVGLLQAAEPYPITSLVRVPWNDPVAIKQFLDTGAQNVIVPMVGNAADAARAVDAVRYPPLGSRGIGSALARSGRWGRVAGYVPNADGYVSLTVQIETAEAVQNAAAIAGVAGVDAVFIGPSDLAASMGFPGRGTAEPAVADAVAATIAAVRSERVPVGVNAFVPADAQRWIDAGADFVFVGADVSIMARGSEELVARFAGDRAAGADTY